VDLRVFHPADKPAVRAGLGLPQDAHVLLFTASSIRGNVWKDYATLQGAVARVADRLKGQPILFIALGEDAPPERIGSAEIRFIPYQESSEAVARYYQAADLYIHAARADTFPNTVLEALACGAPVVATAVGGIPEQVKGVHGSRFTVHGSALNTHGTGEATGVLVPPGDADAMAEAIVALLADEPLRKSLAANAAQDARQRFSLERQADEYLAWYEQLVRA